MSEHPEHSRRLPKPIRIVRARPRLFVSAAVGIAVIAALSGELRVSTRMLVGWDIGIALYLVLALHMMATADIHHIRRRARLQDEGQAVILMLTAVAALASLGAIFALLASSGGGNRQPVDLLLATVTILLSWGFTHVMFALHYAHEYYDASGGTPGGLEFPGGEREPDYWDFVYFSFVIGMTSQVSDVMVSCQPIRRIVTLHGMISFIFNAALLALTVNMAASAI
jgi:uncharacterized membrane protein